MDFILHIFRPQSVNIIHAICKLQVSAKIYAYAHNFCYQINDKCRFVMNGTELYDLFIVVVSNEIDASL